MKRIFLTLVLLSCLYNLIAIEYNTYDMEVEHVFSAANLNAKTDNDLAIITFGQNPGASGPGLFFFYDTLVISDQAYWNDDRRTIFLKEDYSFDKIFVGSFYQSINYINNNLIFGLGYDDITCFSMNNDEMKNKFKIKNSSLSAFDSQYKDFYYQDNTLFIVDKNDTLWGIRNPGLDINENKKNIITEEEIIEEINSGKYKGLTIDTEKRLFLDGELQTLQYKVFVDYWSENSTKISGSIKGYEYTFEELLKSNYSNFLGKDLDGNNYWASRKTLIVFNKTGNIIERARFDIYKSNTYPAVSPSGDVYFMGYGEDNVTLYKIKRQW